jgi:hypothetical protein
MTSISGRNCGAVVGTGTPAGSGISFPGKGRVARYSGWECRPAFLKKKRQTFSNWANDGKPKKQQ